MKRIVTFVIILNLLFTLTGCSFGESVIENIGHNIDAVVDKSRVIEEIKVEQGENCAKIALDGFEGKHTVKLSTGDVSEGTMKLDISVTEGELNVYYDFGLIDNTYKIASLKTGETLERGTYVPSSTSVIIIVECATATTATIDITFFR